MFTKEIISKFLDEEDERDVVCQESDDFSFDMGAEVLLGFQVS